jgi:hypothetical protein
MLGDVKMYNAPALVNQHDEHKEHAEGGGGHDKKITCHDIGDMVVQKGLPRDTPSLLPLFFSPSFLQALPGRTR